MTQPSYNVKVVEGKDAIEILNSYPRWFRHAVVQLWRPKPRRQLLSILDPASKVLANFLLAELIEFSFSSAPVRPQTFRERYRAPLSVRIREKLRPWRPDVVIPADSLAVLLWLFVRRFDIEETAALLTLEGKVQSHREEIASELFALRAFAVYNAVKDLFERGPSMAIEAWFMTAIASLSETCESKAAEYRHVQRVHSKLIASAVALSPTGQFGLGTYDVRSMMARFGSYATSHRGDFTSETAWAKDAAFLFAGVLGESGNLVVESVAELESLACYSAAFDLIKQYGIRSIESA